MGYHINSTMSPPDGETPFDGSQSHHHQEKAHECDQSSLPISHPLSHSEIEKEGEGDTESLPPFPHSPRSDYVPEAEADAEAEPTRQLQQHHDDDDDDDDDYDDDVPTHPVSEDDDDDDDVPTHPVLVIAEEQELGKAIVVLAVPMVMGLLTTYDSFGKSTEMRVVAVTLCLAFASIWNGILLRKTHRTASTAILFVGLALMILALYAYLGCILPIYLKWLPIACSFLSILPLVIALIAFCSCNNKKNKKKKKATKERDLEKGQV